MSYLKTTESRGLGAVAAMDLGAVGARRVPPIRKTPPPIKKKPTPVKKTPTIGVGLLKIKVPPPPPPKKTPPSRTVTLTDHRKKTPFQVGRAGRPLPPPKRTEKAAFTRISSAKKPDSAMLTTQGKITEMVATFTESPGAGVSEAALFTGSPPASERPATVTPADYSAVWTATGPTLVDAVKAEDEMIDSAIDAAKTEAEMTEVPGAAQGAKKTPWLLYGGIALGAYALWRMTK